MSLTELKKLFGATPYSGSHLEKWISTLGAAVGIGFFGFVMWTLQSVELMSERMTLLWLAPCFGATCVLLFAIPHSPFSQPWPVLGGYVLSAVAGLLSVQLLDAKVTQGALAVSLSVVLMYYFRCIHPPGGAATMIPVVSDAIDWWFVLNPILIGGTCLIWSSIIFNAFFPWRRYPAALVSTSVGTRNSPQVGQSSIGLTYEDVSWALQRMESFTDVSAEDLCQLFELATEHQSQYRPSVSDIASHEFYSNGRIGHAWQIYKVVAVSSNTFGQRSVKYRVVEGSNKGFEEEIVLRQFLALAIIPVERVNGNWVRLSRI